MAAGAPYLDGCYLVRGRVPDGAPFPFDLPCVRGLDLAFDTPVTFLVGENGTGKSTLLEGIAELCGFPAGGGGREEASGGAKAASTQLARALRAGSVGVRGGPCQVLVATHSPLLLTFSDARILSFDGGGPPRAVAIEETSHWKLTRAVLADPARFWRSLRDEPR